jgi:tRNA A37 threonylcarbamoyltransferase TsaD
MRDGQILSAFPFLTLASTNDNTELILSQGVGDHTILGFSLDNTASLVLEKFSIDVYQSLREIDLKNGNLKNQISQFVTLYNEKNPDHAIPEGFYDSIIDLRGANLVEKLARYGNPTKFEMPTPLAGDLSCDMSFSGIRTFAQGLFHEPNDPTSGITLSRARRPRRNLNFI